MADFELQEHVQGIQDLSTYDITNEHDISSMDSRAISGILESAVEALADSSESITEPTVFDSYRSLLKYSESLQGSTMSKLLDSVSSAFHAEVDATLRDEDDDQQAYMVHKLPLEMYAFLLHWFVTAADKVKSAGEDDDAPPPPAARGRRGRGGKAAASRAKKTEVWSWMDHIPNILSLICKVFKLKTQRIWTTTAERDTFVNCLTSPAYRVMENAEYMKDQDTRMWAYKVVCLAVKLHGHSLTAQISIMQNLQFYEHIGEPMAELLWVLVKEYDHPQLCDEVLREVAGKTFSGQDPKGGRTVAKFLVKLVQLTSRSVLKQISLLLALLDSEFYPIRVALVEVIGFLIEDIATAEDVTDQNQNHVRKQLNGLYDLLLERTLDIAVSLSSGLR
ncbi:hypothetical protein NM688_g8684 [Phlebia brevispora]|uniref:Uncharacterized protein n=1 Tax=Phlebia brevispora TaxID=194682 RepID=A0ACC1RPL5_9APHY|nr:hypothetical protein NM688_g8684 [Phlebia brevispora]